MNRPRKFEKSNIIIFYDVTVICKKIFTILTLKRREPKKAPLVSKDPTAKT